MRADGRDEVRQSRSAGKALSSACEWLQANHPKEFDAQRGAEVSVVKRWLSNALGYEVTMGEFLAPGAVKTITYQLGGVLCGRKT